MRDQNSAVRRHLNGKAAKNGLDGPLSWAADVPVPFVPVSTDMEGPPPVSSSIPPWQTSQATSSQAASEDGDRRKAVAAQDSGQVGKVSADGTQALAMRTPPTLPVSSPPVSSSPVKQLEESGRKFLDAGPMLQRALLRKKLEHAVEQWLVLVEIARSDGRSTSPAAIRRAEEEIERVAKALREIK